MQYTARKKHKGVDRHLKKWCKSKGWVEKYTVNPDSWGPGGSASCGTCWWPIMVDRRQPDAFSSAAQVVTVLAVQQHLVAKATTTWRWCQTWRPLGWNWECETVNNPVTNCEIPSPWVYYLCIVSAGQYNIAFIAGTIMLFYVKCDYVMLMLLDCNFCTVGNIAVGIFQPYSPCCCLRRVGRVLGYVIILWATPKWLLLSRVVLPEHCGLWDEQLPCRQWETDNCERWWADWERVVSCWSDGQECVPRNFHQEWTLEKDGLCIVERYAK